MLAWVLNRVSDVSKVQTPLDLVDMPVPVPKEDEVLLRVSCCGICHTELDEIEGRTPPPRYPIIPGHQVIGRIEARGPRATRFRTGDRVGVAWIFSACGTCTFCRQGLENLCDHFQATGRDQHGGYAQYMTVKEDFAYAIPEAFTDAEAAPLLCAGAIGYRALRLTNLQDGEILGLTGFGASGHLVIMMARHRYPRSPVFVLARSPEEQEFARSLGAAWAGDLSQTPPEPVNAFIDTTPVWSPVLVSLLHLKPGGRLVINAIRKESQDQEALLSLRYADHLWMEKEIKSVANITRADVGEFLALAAMIPIKPEVELYPFDKANAALADLRLRHVRGAKVLQAG